MTVEQSIELVMKEIGPLADLLAIRAYPQERAWQLAVDEEIIVWAKLAPSTGILVLSAELGPPPDNDRANFYDLLLRYAHAWQATGGLRISKAETDGALWLLRDCCAVDLPPLEFAEILSDYVAKVYAWRDGIETYRNGSPTGLPAVHMPQAGALRA
jgi:hypothetical protein